MMIANNDGTVTAGPLDMLCIWHHDGTGRYHVVFWEEHPMPGRRPADVADTPSVRLFSKLHHTEGADTLDGAREHLREMRERLLIRDANVDSDNPMSWDGELAHVIVFPNWVAQGRTVADLAREMA